ncbi:MerR family transcriptional regulator [Marinomonas sp. SBI22]|uniref:MerR family transcriptional regulator n=1 Tax=unclassified Marinomonas TaxID=196814 RepID=UPI0007AFD1A8|nr:MULTISPECIES: MerR family transcriptional regulator [unclassified Marinomonas]KZM42112.1 MerR family transcriptional regulator [Marinomonas sp. SBI22]KZM47044.1 MerR family transcriptional regulator [Marinomonas sp. SBI8L]
MKIADVSRKTGLSAHTIRYYEKQGLVKTPAKDASGHRAFSEKEVELLNWVACLKKSGMSLNKIKAYVAAFEADDSPLATDILEQHLLKLKNQQEDIHHYIDVTSEKIKRLKGLT